jgi:cell division protease FtsH
MLNKNLTYLKKKSYLIKMNYIIFHLLFYLFMTNSLKINLGNSHDIISNRVFYKRKPGNPYGQKYYEELMKRREQESFTERLLNKKLQEKLDHKYPVSKKYYEDQLSRLNSRNNTIRDESILGFDSYMQEKEENEENITNTSQPKLTIVLNQQDLLEAFGIQLTPFENEDGDKGEDEESSRFLPNRKAKIGNKKSENFEVITEYGINFKNVGGYDKVKQELNQCVDLLKNHTKYARFNVRVPKGLVLEGPPGTGKTLLAKALAGEANCAFIAVSGSDFQEKYVGVGSTRIKELFDLACKHKPCIIFIDEIDALGRKRSSDGESSSNERDTTLNALLVEMDGFKNTSGVFIVSATNRIDLLDKALTRPGRIDKQIFIGLPDLVTRRAIFNIHIKGKPYDDTIKIEELIENSDGLTGAQIENLLNEAMLNALRENREKFNYGDFDLVFNKMMVGWQPNDHEFTQDIVEHIAIHEMGHAILGLLSKHHSKMSKVVINLSSPKSPGYTVFETSTSSIYTRESLFEHLMILLGGRIAEEIFYGGSVTTGAINDFDEALKLAERMVTYYGMGSNIIYPSSSDKYKELIDNDVIELINKAHTISYNILEKSKSLIRETSQNLLQEKFLTADYLNTFIDEKYSHLRSEKIEFED